ncbi:hypothetical protein D929_00009 [Enterococcus faecalis 02-MB-P-10]|uniref:hypothetical protein n=1 Tax=Enterococcus faecalis TaxID=1351 RepID=UPI0003530DC8|nr:hypothetical protein [Enterococcus faecalis]EPH78031.1 hypothetical protein D929_00009 [Enterococcus faecalis 02-MB-P-10]
MTDYDKKEVEALNKITNVLEKLDSNLDELDSLNEDDKKHNLKKWITEKKAIHDIKKIAHEAGKYEKYNEKEFQQEIGYIESLDI